MSSTLSARPKANSEASPAVLIIDDDPEVLNSIGRLLRSVGMDARLFSSVPEFLKSKRPNGPSCLVLDVRLPGQSGLDFQRELATSDNTSSFLSSSSPDMATYQCAYKR